MDTVSAFRNVPVTKFLVSVIGSCSAWITLVKIDNHPQLWKLWITPWAFSTISSTVVGTWFIYKMKIIERRFGSAKYAALVFTSYMATLLLQTSLFWAHRHSLKQCSGPYVLLFTVLYQYYRLVPPGYESQMLGIPFTDKTYVYMAATQLMCGNALSSVIPSVFGLMHGMVYARVKRIQAWRFPLWMRTVTSSVFKTQNAPATTTTAVPVLIPENEENINTMAALFPDYSRENIKQALIQSHQDLNRAADILLRMG